MQSQPTTHYINSSYHHIQTSLFKISFLQQNQGPYRKRKLIHFEKSKIQLSPSQGGLERVRGNQRLSIYMHHSSIPDARPAKLVRKRDEPNPGSMGTI